uniref:CS domain-containing protein n=1 Tax=Peromyscus maniculatus bairdii TaxID=230844 RepID=A0A8C8UDJ0_PERMB
MQQKSQKKPELDNEKPAAVVAPLTTGYTVKISNYGWDQSDKFVKIYITLTGVHQVPTENVQSLPRCFLSFVYHAHVV